MPDMEDMFIEEFITALESARFEYIDSGIDGEVLVNDETIKFLQKIGSVINFKDSDLLTKNNGFIMRMNNGEEYQVTIVESTRR